MPVPEKVLLSEMTPREVESAARRTDTVIIPFGANDANGMHKPLGTDMIVAEGFALLLGKTLGVPVAPGIPWGNSTVQMGFHGTITVRNHILSEVLRDICLSLSHSGFRRFLTVVGHGQNLWAAGAIGDDLRDCGLMVVSLHFWSLMSRLCADLARTKDHPMGHGSELGTAVVMALRPDLVDLANAEPGPQCDNLYAKYFWTHYPFPIATFPHWSNMAEAPSMGDPSQASPEQGRMVLDRCLEFAVQLVRDMQGAQLPEPAPWAWISRAPDARRSP